MVECRAGRRSDESSRPPLRVRLDLAYDGTAFSGWAAQPTLRTVQGELSAALTTVLRSAEPVRVTVAGRTDAGVHARGQVAHVDLDPAAWASLPGRSDRDPGVALVSRLGGILPADVVVRAARPAPDGFDARFSAVERRYLYRIADTGAVRDPLRRHDTVWWRKPLDVGAMDEAARSLVGLRDFAAFCRQREGATTVRTLLDFSWIAPGGRGAGRDRARRCVLPLHGAIPRRGRRPGGGGAAGAGLAPGAAGPRRTGGRHPRHAAPRAQPRGGRLPGRLRAGGAGTRHPGPSRAGGRIVRMKARPTDVVPVDVVLGVPGRRLTA